MFMVFHDQNEFHPSRLDLRVARAEEISISGQPGPWIPMSAPAGSWVGGWAIGACDGPTHTRSAESSLPGTDLKPSVNLEPDRPKSG